MSQAGFGDSSSQESIEPSMPEPQTPLQSVSVNVLGEPTTLFNALPRQALEQELQFCNERTQQAQVLLRQAQEQLQLSQLVIQRQETLTQTLQSRIDQLERELQDVHTNCDELRNRLKRQQHHTSQLKAALERCLDTSTPANNEMATSALESWSVAKLADEKITPVQSNNDAQMQNVVKIAPVYQSSEQLTEQLTAQLTSQEQSINNVRISEDSANAESPPESESGSASSESSIPTKVQPISPLIMRPHKAYQGSPITGLNLPPLQSATPIVAEPVPDSLFPRYTQSVSERPEPPNTQPRETDASISPSSGLTNSSMVSTVATPKFMQSLYGNAKTSDNKTSDNLDRDETDQVAIANASPRKAVNSLAAVQLPQFPPLPRR
ncbi:hypothetical protein [Pseudanabaena mucicola]|uniref:Uncharacterized protein n=1 Tax=Pseudanabaena mucicola FACHB-723 TaxID=2692860 RepID=A0ABR7ZVZ4_9CYAN|nr:hypothetical protein [Pseudanabaena mucicola]MBD2188136.1 hypothetical protein [Pseudanabaena mucicola FACHB-723]